MSQLTKRCTNELVATQKSETRFLIVVADRQQRKALAVHYCILASQSPLTSSCSGVRFKTNCVCRVPNGGLRSRKSKLLAANLQLYRPPYGEQLRGSGDGHIRQGRRPVKIRHSPSSSLGRHEYRTRSKGRKILSQHAESAKHCVMTGLRPQLESKFSDVHSHSQVGK